MESLCAMCQWPNCSKKQCTGCYAIQYCSKRCQSLDWPAHKLICRSWTTFIDDRPSPDVRAAIWFPRDAIRPKMVWVHFAHDSNNFYMPDFDSFLGANHHVVYSLPFNHIKRRGLQMDHTITVWYRDWDENINKSLYAAVEACHGLTMPTIAAGDYVALAGKPGDSAHGHGDMTPSHFRHVLDYFSTYFDGTPRDTPTAGSIQAVKISCPQDQLLYGCDILTSVSVDPDFVGTTAVSELARALGDDLQISELSRSELERDVDAVGDPSTQLGRDYIDVLLTDINPKSPDWGETIEVARIEGSAIVFRESHADIDISSVHTICQYAVEVLKPLFTLSLQGLMSREDVLAEITRPKMRLWRPDDTPEVVQETRRSDGFVSSIRRTLGLEKRWDGVNLPR
jgi:hypothetical protein